MDNATLSEDVTGNKKFRLKLHFWYRCFVLWIPPRIKYCLRRVSTYTGKNEDLLGQRGFLERFSPDLSRRVRCTMAEPY